MHRGHLGGPSFRRALPGATSLMKNQTNWALDREDLFKNFLSTLP